MNANIVIPEKNILIHYAKPINSDFHDFFIILTLLLQSLPELRFSIDAEL